MRPGPFSVVQLTDTHILPERSGRLRGINTFESLSSVLEQAARQVPEADAYVVTGDISQDGSPESYRIVKELLAGVACPVYVIPGNHDDVDAMHGHLLTENIGFPPHADVGNWRLMFLNTQVAGEEYGFLESSELDTLTRAAADGPPNRLVCMHHPPIELRSPWIDRSMLRNAEEMFESALGSQNTTAVICGHAHQEFTALESGVKVMGTPSTCAQFRPGTAKCELDDAAPGFRIVELYDSGRLSTRVIRVQTSQTTT